MSDLLKKGDVVQLISGGPNMAIVQIERDNQFVHCLWFDGGKLSQSVFPINLLVPTSEDTAFPLQSSSSLQNAQAN